MSKIRGSLLPVAAALCGALFAPVASALVITPIVSSDATGATTTLIPALLAPSSGITVVPGSATFQGNVGTSTFGQSCTYTGFNLAPSSGSTPTLALPNGIALSSGIANVPNTNTVNQFSRNPNSGSNALLGSLVSPISTNDANMLTFNFTLAPGQNAVTALFVFGTDEFPTQAVTDIFGFFVDGVNYAKFPNGQLISNTPGNPTNFIGNPVGSGLYDIEYNGLTRVLQVTGLLNPSLSEHTLAIGVADTSDTIFDSGVFIGALVAGTAAVGGIGDPGPGPGPGLPEPGTLGLLAVGLLAANVLRRRKLV
jgi:PEP-CTERM motif